jgi:hypothetical protein
MVKNILHVTKAFTKHVAYLLYLCRLSSCTNNKIMTHVHR